MVVWNSPIWYGQPIIPAKLQVGKLVPAYISTGNTAWPNHVGRGNVLETEAIPCAETSWILGEGSPGVGSVAESTRNQSSREAELDSRPNKYQNREK